MVRPFAFPLSFAVRLSIRNLVICSSLMSLWLCPVVAQSQSLPTKGVTMEPHEYDSINLANLAISINVPFRSKPGVIPMSISYGGTPSLSYSAGYWFANDGVFAKSFPGVSRGIIYSKQTAVTCGALGNTTKYTAPNYTDPFGVSHPLPLNWYWYGNPLGGICVNPTS
jgi:hypothetical protein